MHTSQHGFQEQCSTLQRPPSIAARIAAEVLLPQLTISVSILVVFNGSKEGGKLLPWQEKEHSWIRKVELNGTRGLVRSADETRWREAHAVDGPFESRSAAFHSLHWK